MGNKILEIYGKNVFDDIAMKKYLSQDIYIKYKKLISEEKDLSEEIVKAMANAMKQWAIDRGATHYTHWFQPLTNNTAEKHNSFLAFDDKNKVITKLSGRELIKGESDASSFPSGGIRATFEARGYTAWDYTSNAFVKLDETGNTLFIPTAFMSFTGEALDKKTPLLRSIEAINIASKKLLSLFGNNKVKKVIPMLGAEQEYFLIDRDLFLQRKDLIYTGHTLFGNLPPKGQEMDDHYYGSLRSKIGAFMNDVNFKLWELGVPAKTHHNEVAPAQHELAVIYEEANIACDHNQLVMEVLRKTASKYNLVCLLHEKPFKGLNGSGKHNNWSLVTDTGINLLKPNENIVNDVQFIFILSLILQSVDENAKLLRASASNVGNDLRLGGNEAPPSIISCFVGEDIYDILISYIENDNKKIKSKKEIIETGSLAVPDLYKDLSDRNRTSPFAFTGNKFEFRMVGSSDSCAMPITVINTIVADTFTRAYDVISKEKNKKEAIKQYIKNILKKHIRIVFNGNCYDKEWEKEAKRRGIPIIKDMVSAIKSIDDKDVYLLFEKYKVLSNKELKSRIDVLYEQYIKSLKIDAYTMIDMVKKFILPSSMKYVRKIADTIIKIKQIENNKKFYYVEKKIFDELNENIIKLKVALEEVENKVLNRKSNKLSLEEEAFYIKEKLVPAMEKLRLVVDTIEPLVDKEDWPLLSYGDLIFEVSKI